MNKINIYEKPCKYTMQILLNPVRVQRSINKYMILNIFQNVKIFFLKIVCLLGV